MADRARMGALNDLDPMQDPEIDREGFALDEHSKDDVLALRQDLAADVFRDIRTLTSDTLELGIALIEVGQFDVRVREENDEPPPQGIARVTQPIDREWERVVEIPLDDRPALRQQMSEIEAKIVTARARLREMVLRKAHGE